jgi:hypothetical protein
MQTCDKFEELKEVLEAAHQKALLDTEKNGEQAFLAFLLMEQIEYAVELLDADSLADHQA